MQVQETKQIGASADAVWAIAGDIGNVSRYVPAIASSRLEGDIRHAEFAGGGGAARERIVEVDNEGRSYVYEYLDGPLALAVYRSRFSVSPEGADRSVVRWESELEAADPSTENELGATISEIYRQALDELDRLASPSA